tara:strand:- start:83 stop:436 length:354 start_codon:yes stop_codon:yes gene_type:complete
MSFINVYQDERGLWSASLCNGSKEAANIGGSYPKSGSAKIDGQNTWGRDIEVKMSRNPMFITDKARRGIIQLLNDGIETKVIASRFNLKPEQIRAIKAHLTMGNYDSLYGGEMVSTG